jgi:group I intron endonuclease
MMEDIGCIYIVKNNVNFKVYVGQTTRDFDVRWRQHQNDAKCGKDYNLGKAIRKYGIENFSAHIAATASSKDDLYRLETCWIISLRSNNPKFGYNMTFGGEGTLGYKASEETRRKQSKARKGRKLSEQARMNIAKAKLGPKNPNYGKTPSEETRKKSIAARLGKQRKPISKEALLRAILSGMDHHELAASFGVAWATIYERCRRYWGPGATPVRVREMECSYGGDLGRTDRPLQAGGADRERGTISVPDSAGSSGEFDFSLSGARSTSEESGLYRGSPPL